MSNMKYRSLVDGILGTIIVVLLYLPLMLIAMVIGLVEHLVEKEGSGSV